MQLEIKQETITSEKKLFRLNPIAQPFVLKGIQMRGVLGNSRSQLENIKSVMLEWMQVYQTTKTRVLNKQVDKPTKRIETRNRHSILEGDDENDKEENDRTTQTIKK